MESVVKEGEKRDGVIGVCALENGRMYINYPERCAIIGENILEDPPTPCYQSYNLNAH